MSAFSDPSILDSCNLDNETKECLILNIQRRMTPQAVKVRADIEVACYSYEGIDAVKAALKEGLKFATEEMPVKVSERHLYKFSCSVVLYLKTFCRHLSY